MLNCMQQHKASVRHIVFVNPERLVISAYVNSIFLCSVFGIGQISIISICLKITSSYKVVVDHDVDRTGVETW